MAFFVLKYAIYFQYLRKTTMKLNKNDKMYYGKDFKKSVLIIKP